VEIEIEGQVTQLSYKQSLGSQIPICTIVKENGKISITNVNSLCTTSGFSKEIWGVTTEQFVPVSSLMLSPNHWENTAPTGNKHYFFVLKDCKNPDTARGLYNEFLKPELDTHRKVFELLGAKLKAPYSDEQVTGIGFSSTQSNELVTRVSGAFNRTLKVQF
jgi:hypothetical protein